MISSDDIRALKGSLRTEYAAIYGYGVVSAYISGSSNADVARAWSAHRARRDRIQRFLEESDEKAPEPEIAYTSSKEVWDSLTATQLASLIEDDCSVAWSRALQICIHPQAKKIALQSLLSSAQWTARWRIAAGTTPPLDPLPGLRKLNAKEIKESYPGTSPQPVSPTVPHKPSSSPESPTTDMTTTSTPSTYVIPTEETEYPSSSTVPSYRSSYPTEYSDSGSMG